MSSLFEVPAQLASLLALVAAHAGEAQEASALRHASASLTSRAEIAAEPLSGPLRFGEKAWLRALHENPDAVADDGFAGRVFVTSGGRYYVPSAGERARILSAREDAAVAARVAQAVAERNAARLGRVLGRRPTAADLYIAHALGTEAALGVVRAVIERPDDTVGSVFPGLVAGMPELDSGALTVAQLYQRVVRAVDAPPRLVAIGMQRDGARAGGDGDGWLSWQARVSAVPVEPAVSPQ